MVDSSAIFKITQKSPQTRYIPRISYELRLYSDRVEYVGISPLDNHVNILTSIKTEDIDSVSYKRDWNNFFLKYALFIHTKDGKTKKLSMISGLTLQEAQKSKDIIESNR